MKFLKKNYKDSAEQVELGEFFIYPGHIQRFIAVFLISAFFIFMAGYFWGKKSIVEHLANQFDQESFGDKIYASMCSLYDNGYDGAESSESIENDQDMQDQDEEKLKNQSNGNGSLEQLAEETKPQHTHYAVLTGFGSRKAAENYYNHLKRQYIDAEIIERNSVSSKGLTRTWYQVIVRSADKNALEELVARLKQNDHLNNKIEIFELDNEQ